MRPEIMILLALALGIAALALVGRAVRGRDRRRSHSRVNRRRAYYKSWQLVFGRRRHLRLSHYQPEEVEAGS